jgi:glutathione-regulated potassium-efflux system ancillary protein KefF
MHGHPFEAFTPAISQTARFCGMHWEPPIVVHGAHRISASELHADAERYRRRLEMLASRPDGGNADG